MNKRVIIITIALLSLLAGELFFLNQQSQSSEKAVVVQEEKTTKEDFSNNNTANSRYIEYSKANLDQAVNNRKVLYFYANWCSTCRPADKNLKGNQSKIPEDVVVIRINYNDSDTEELERNLANQYGITYQHTFVQIDAQGKEVAKWNGGQIEELLANLR